jgi:hypothetical protein
VACQRIVVVPDDARMSGPTMLAVTTSFRGRGCRRIVGSVFRFAARE